MCRNMVGLKHSVEKPLLKVTSYLTYDLHVRLTATNG
jgi:hypothetical protein